MSTSLLCLLNSASPVRPAYRAAALQLADALHQRNLGLIYDGSHDSLGALVAEHLLAMGGQVLALLGSSQAHPSPSAGLSSERCTDRQQRKARLLQLADAFIALPGGNRGLQEVIEVWAWAKLGQHHKPLGLLDGNGFYSQLGGFSRSAASPRQSGEAPALLQIDSDAELLLERLQEACSTLPDCSPALHRARTMVQHPLH